MKIGTQPNDSPAAKVDANEPALANRGTESDNQTSNGQGNEDPKATADSAKAGGIVDPATKSDGFAQLSQAEADLTKDAGAQTTLDNDSNGQAAPTSGGIKFGEVRDEQRVEKIDGENQQSFVAPDRSSESLGFDAERAQQQRDDQGQNVVTEFANQAVAGNVTDVDRPAGQVIFSSHPIQNFSIGRYSFENGQLTLEADEVADFESFINKLPPADRMQIKKIDLGAVDAIVEQRAAATKQIDSGAGRAAMEALRLQVPKFGSQPLESMNRDKQL
jgi:hypothetical protein